jgi:hypothetical protein
MKKHAQARPLLTFFWLHPPLLSIAIVSGFSIMMVPQLIFGIMHDLLPLFTAGAQDKEGMSTVLTSTLPTFLAGSTDSLETNPGVEISTAAEYGDHGCNFFFINGGWITITLLRAHSSAMILRRIIFTLMMMMMMMLL